MQSGHSASVATNEIKSAISTGTGLQERFAKRIRECKEAGRHKETALIADDSFASTRGKYSTVEKKSFTKVTTASREDTPLLGRPTPRGAFEVVGTIRNDSKTPQIVESNSESWLDEAQKSLIEEAPPPLYVRASTASASDIASIDLASWNRAHLSHYTEPRNHVFPIFFYEAPPKPEIDRVALEAQVTDMLKDFRASRLDKTSGITPKMLQEAEIAHQRISVSGSLSSGSSLVESREITQKKPDSAFTVSVKSLAYRPNPEAVRRKNNRRKEKERQRGVDDKIREAGWNRPEYLMTPSTTYKTGNIEVWRKVRNSKEDKRLRVPFERAIADIKRVKTIAELEEEAKIQEQHSSAFLPNGLPKSSALDPNRIFQRISTKIGDESVAKQSNVGRRDNDAFAKTQDLALQVIQLIDRREEAVKALRKLVKEARSGKTIVSRKLARKQLVPRRLGPKLDIVRKASVDVALAVDIWRVAIDEYKDVKGSNPYGLSLDTTTSLVDGEAYFGLTPPPRPFLWRGLNYMVKMSYDLRFLDKNSAAWGGRLLTRVGLLSTEANPLLLPVTLAQCNARAPISVMERSALPLRVRSYRGIDTSRIRAAATIIEDEVKHLNERATKLSSVLKYAARIKYEKQTKARAELRAQAKRLLEDERNRHLPSEDDTSIGNTDASFLAANTKVVTIGQRMNHVAKQNRKMLTTSQSPKTPDLLKQIKYDPDSGFSNESGSSILFTEESSTVVAEAIVAHALAVATDLDTKASLTLLSKPSTAEHRELLEREPTIKSLATEFAQQLLDRSQSKSGAGSPSFEKLISMRRQDFHAHSRHNMSLNATCGDANSGDDVGKFANQGSCKSELSQTPQASRQATYHEMVSSITNADKMQSTDEYDRNDEQKNFVSPKAKALEEGTSIWTKRSLSPVEESALKLATLLDERSSDVGNLDDKEGPHLFSHALAMAPMQAKGNPVVESALDYASYLIAVASSKMVPDAPKHLGAEALVMSPKHSLDKPISKSHDDTKSISNEGEGKVQTDDVSNILMHAIIDDRPHDISIVTNYPNNSVQIVVINDLGAVSRLRLNLSDIEAASPAIKDLPAMEQARHLASLLEYRSIQSNDSRANTKEFLVYTPMFKYSPRLRPNSGKRRERGSSPAFKVSTAPVGSFDVDRSIRSNEFQSGILIVGDRQGDTHESKFKQRSVSPLKELETIYNLSAPYIMCLESAIKIQAVARGLQAKRKVEFKRKVRDEKYALKTRKLIS